MSPNLILFKTNMPFLHKQQTAFQSLKSSIVKQLLCLYFQSFLRVLMAPNGDILVGSLIMIVCCHYQKTQIHVTSQSFAVLAGFLKMRVCCCPFQRKCHIMPHSQLFGKGLKIWKLHEGLHIVRAQAALDIFRFAIFFMVELI